MQSYSDFINELDKRLCSYAAFFKDFIMCKEGCSDCCENGDYPISQPEVEYLMQGYALLENDKKIQVQKNIQKMQKGGACPFLINKSCSVYKYRPIICRVHGLAYLCAEGTVKLPYCANEGKNFSSVLSSGIVEIAPIKENLDTKKVISLYDSKAAETIKNLIDWIK